ncbi:MAG TPA: nucleotide exchange factor GrpE [Planctomicrobium sp.]|nr:nucleotide exchange factor GrpE [Planctomicrobium sp.]
MNSVDPLPSDPTQESPIEAAAAEEVLPIDPVVQLTAERDELRDLLLRTRAEMDNIRKRMNRERDEERRYASLPVVQQFLPAFDNLQRAVAAGEQDHNAASLVQGVQMVLSQFEEALGQVGVTVIPALGLPFDPNVHQALQQFPTSEHPPMTVLQELQKGFLIHDRVIRPSQVIVSCAPPEA